ncbi:Ctr copper transporter family-domain-containing protein [Dipodascopsis uninucleata]
MDGMDMGSSGMSMDMDMTSRASMVSSTMSAMSSMVTSMAMTGSMAMDMSSTSMDMNMGTSTSMDMSSSTADSMDMSSMDMLFHTSTTDSLFAAGWTPSSTGKYAGTCIFLIVLAVIYRFTHIIKHRSERYFTTRALDNRYRGSIKATRSDAVDTIEKSVDSSEACCPDAATPTGFFSPYRPWCFSSDVPMALIQTLLSGISYLLMLAVMTFNVGYFLSVLGGIFLGELLLGRFSANFTAH